MIATEAANPATTRLASSLLEFEQTHKSRIQRTAQAAAGMLILLSAMGLLSWASMGRSILGGAIDFDGGLLLWAAASLFAVWIDRRVGVPLSVSLLGGYVLARQVLLAGYWWVLVLMLALGVTLRMVNGFGSGVGPRSAADPRKILTGAIWLFAYATGQR